MPAEHIQDVVDQLTLTTRRFEGDGSAMGYFPALYRTVTMNVKRGIEDGDFVDGERMDRFDVLFALRYFDALEAWEAGGSARESCPKSWAKAFRLSERFPNLHPMVHMVLGVNAHVNLDLAVAAADTVPADSIEELHVDYVKINAKFAQAIDDTREALSKESIRVRYGDLLTGSFDDRILNFSIVSARYEAWETALLLAETPHSRERLIAQLDRSTAKIADRICLSAGAKAVLEEGARTAKRWVENLFRSGLGDEKAKDDAEDREQIRRVLADLLGDYER